MSIDDYINALWDVDIWLIDSFEQFISFLFGSGSSDGLTDANKLFITAALPSLLFFGTEIIFSFILSFRARRFRIYVPFVTSLRVSRPVQPVQYSIYRADKKHLFHFKKRENLNFNKPRLLSFSSSQINNVDGKDLRSKINYKVDKPYDKRLYNNKYDDVKYHHLAQSRIIIRLSHFYHNLHYKYSQWKLSRKGDNG